MRQIDLTCLIQLDELIFDLQVGTDADGSPMLVLDDLIELFPGEDGRIDAVRACTGSFVVADYEFAQLDEDEFKALVNRRLRISMLAGRLLGLRIDEALAALAA
jgi:hypothetical protein